MLFSRRADDADVIRARLRALLAEGAGARGWVPADDPDDPDDSPGPDPGHGLPLPAPARRPWDDEEQDTWSVDPPTAAPDVASGARGAPQLPVGSGRHRAAGPSARVDPGPHGARTLWVVAVLAAVVVAGWSWFDRPAVEPVADGTVTSAVPVASTGSPTPGAEPSSTAAPADIVVAVVGQVVSPGVVTLPAGSRVADAVAAAGGLLPEADPAGFNAAALLTDGQQVAVGVPGVADLPEGTAGGAAAGPVDLNSATLTDLDALPGVGPVLAQRILDHRAAQGPFTTVEQLDDVTGIGPSLYAEISPLVTV